MTEEPAVEPAATEEPAAEPAATEEPAVEPAATEEPAVEPDATEEPAVEPAATEEPVAEPDVTEEPAAEPDATEEPAVEPDATEEPAAEGKDIAINMDLLNGCTIDVVAHLDANKAVTELTLTLNGELDGLTQEMLDAFAEQIVGKQLPLVLRAYADETTAEEQIIEEMENRQDISYGILEALNMVAEQEQ